MSELVVSLSQKPWELLGGVSDGYFTHNQREPILFGRKEEISLRKANIGEVFGYLDEMQAHDFEREVVLHVVELHPLLSSISTGRCIMQEQVAGGAPILYFQIEGRLDREPGVATIIFDPNVHDKQDLVRFESDYGDPAEVGRREGLKPVRLEEAYRHYPERARTELEWLIVQAVLRGSPDNVKFIQFDRSIACSGIFLPVTHGTVKRVVVQYPVLLRSQSALLQADIQFGQSEQEMTVEVHYQTKVIGSE